MTNFPLVGRNGAIENCRSAFCALDDAEDGHDALGLRAVCQNVDNSGTDLYYENDNHSHNNGFFLSRLN